MNVRTQFALTHYKNSKIWAKYILRTLRCKHYRFVPEGTSAADFQLVSIVEHARNC